MAVTIQIYDHTAKLFFNHEIDPAGVFKLELLNDSAVFTAANTTKNSVDNTGAYEVSGNGWAAGGETLGSVAVTQVTTNDAKFDAADIDKTASVGAIGPAYKALLYIGTLPLAFINFGGVKQADAGTHFIVTWDATGIFVVTVAAQ
jgi:hypothetical protein